MVESGSRSFTIAVDDGKLGPAMSGDERAGDVVVVAASPDAWERFLTWPPAPGLWDLAESA